jgi:hypothetical protein
MYRCRMSRSSRGASIGLPLEPGERLCFHERRAPPLFALTLAPAVVLAVSAATVSSPLARVGLALAAAALTLLGLRLRGRGWLEDLVVTDQRVAVAPRDGEPRLLRLDELAGVRERGTTVRFTARDGSVLAFGHVRSARSLRKRLDELRPDLSFAIDYDPHCGTCGLRW